MIRQPFSDAWAFRPKVNEFSELGSAAPAEPVTLPHDAVIATSRDAEMDNGAPTGYFRGGTWEYTKKFFVPEEYANKRVRIEFEGVYRSALVYINGDLAGHWAYGYTDFCVAADDYLRYGQENELRVEARAHRDSRWYSGAGITRPVHLIVAEPVHIALDGIRVTTADIDAERAVVQIATTVENEGTRISTATLETIVYDTDDRIVASDTTPVTVGAGRCAVGRQRMVLADPALWSPASPHLYRVSVILRAGTESRDEAETTFGIRTLHLDAERGLRLNAEPINLRGACIHHDNGILGAAAIARADERRVELLKAAGFNAIRMAHNPMSRAMLDACDRIGMLVMDEAFDMWTRSKSDFDYALDFQDWWERDLEAMVRKDQNHPSVFAYSIGNEIPEVGGPHGALWARRLAERVRELDGDRFVTSGVNGMLAVMEDLMAMARERGQASAQAADGAGINTMLANAGEYMNKIGASELVTERTAEVFSVLDIAGMNYLDSRYGLDGKLFPHRVIVGSETFPTLIDRLWALVRQYPHVIGDFTWTGWDYLGEAGIGRTQYAGDPGALQGGYPWLAAWCGDIDITGVRRPASYYREIVFGLRADPYIAVQRPKTLELQRTSSPWAWSDALASWTWPGHEGQPIVVEVYGDADEVELLVNGESAGRKPIDEQQRYRAEFQTTFEPGHVTAVAYRDGSECGRTELRTAAGEVRLELEVDRAVINSGAEDLAYVEVTLADAEGTTFSGFDREITVTVEGAGILQALGSADPENEQPFTRPNHRTYNGRVLAVIRPTRPGEIIIKAADDTGLTADALVTAR